MFCIHGSGWDPSKCKSCKCSATSGGVSTNPQCANSKVLDDGYTVEFAGHRYRTLDRTTVLGNEELCQSNFLSVRSIMLDFSCPCRKAGVLSAVGVLWLPAYVWALVLSLSLSGEVCRKLMDDTLQDETVLLPTANLEPEVHVCCCDSCVHVLVSPPPTGS